MPDSYWSKSSFFLQCLPPSGVKKITLYSNWVSLRCSARQLTTSEQCQKGQKQGLLITPRANSSLTIIWADFLLKFLVDMRLKLIEKKNDKVWLFDGGDKCIANVKMGAKLKIKKKTFYPLISFELVEYSWIPIIKKETRIWDYTKMPRPGEGSHLHQHYKKKEKKWRQQNRSHFNQKKSWFQWTIKICFFSFFCQEWYTA